ncbi:class I SAM-dependent methyltransferase [Pedobacter arcticus]|uniref:class I SAM-dependent methyltransferase n=1 Tax=Pedobacter arcticus TaxID=752140 RepID=UPI000319BEDC|nr:class I SAM-dependent methyltransferase [Pedobacter arcticus]
METLKHYVETYTNTAETNDFVWEHFRDEVNKNPFLKNHRDYVEEKQAGFGDRSFHHMWYLLLQDLKEKKEEITCLEIGIFKGQVISLWALIAKEIGLKAKITGISPLEGNYPNNSLFRNYYIRKLLSYVVPSIRRDFADGNIHIQEDFIGHIQKMFDNSGLDLREVNLIKGYSNDENISSQVQNQKFDIVYIDGDHSYKVCKEDLDNYAKIIKPNGYLVMDDASNFNPGTKFFKGIVEVSKACEEIDATIFKNILNVGHNRIYQRVG